MKKDIREIPVSEWMTLSAPVISPRTSVNEALRMVRGYGIPALPVCEEGRFFGLVREKDLLELAPSRATLLSRHEMPMLLEKVTVRTVVRNPVATVAHDVSLREAAEIMVRNSSEILPVLENGRFAGLISWVDLFDAALGECRPG